MAFSLHLLTSNLVTRSVVPTLASASRFLNNVASPRSYTTIPKDDTNDQPWLKLTCPEISKLSFHMWMFAGKDRRLILNVPKEGLSLDLQRPGLKEEHWRLFTQAKTPKECYFGLELPDETSSDDVKKAMKELTPSNKDEFKTNIIAHHIISSFREIRATLSWDYYDMFHDRSILGKWLCPLIATTPQINSFSIYKREGDKGLDIRMAMPGRQDMKLTTQGLRVSLEMDKLERKDVKVYFDYDTFFIEGKTKDHHYITGIHLPKGIQQKNKMIKRRMKRGVLYAFLPCCVKKDELVQIKAQLKPKLYITS